MPSVLEVRDLVTEFRTEQGTVRAVDGVSFEIPARGTLGVVGESGCGKSVTALSIMRLVTTPPGRIASGSIRYAGKDLVTLPEREMRAIRGNRIAMIFQEPMTSLNPVFTVGDQVGEAVRLHQHKSKSDARAISSRASARTRAFCARSTRSPSTCPTAGRSASSARAAAARA